LESKGIVPDVAVGDFAGEEIVGGGGAGSGNGATIKEAGQDDPQLTAAVQLAKQAARGGNK
jgi:hypothetical protein